jgi:hypothetical protein
MPIPFALPAVGKLLLSVAGIGRGIAALLGAIRATRIGRAIWFGLFVYMGGVIGRMFQLAGVTLVANEFVTPHLTDLVAGRILGLPAEWVQFIGLTKVDQAITIVLSAVAIRTIDQVQIKRHRESWQTPL